MFCAYLYSANRRTMIKPKTSKHHYDVTHERVDDGYALTIEVGQKSTDVTVTAADIIEWTDSKESTYGIDDNDNVIMEQCRAGERAYTYPIHDYISDFLSHNDWLSFAQSLPAYRLLKGKPNTNLRLLTAQARRVGMKDHGVEYVSRTAAKPVWWAYDFGGKWVMVDGVKVELTEKQVIDFIGSQNYMKSDENGFYAIQYRRKGDKKMYFGFDTMIQMADEALWWKLSQELAAQMEAA